MQHLYRESLFEPADAAESWWQASAGPAPETDSLSEETEARCDIAVIGGGYTGLSAALHLARDHGADVRVLEAGTPGWGASGRNGGFCVAGASKLGYEAMIAKYGLEATRAFHASQQEATALVATLLESEDIDAERAGRAEISWAHKPNRMAGLAAERDFLARTFGQQAELLDKAGLAERGIAGPAVHGGLVMPGYFGLHPLKYAHGLCRAARRHGARIHANAAVTGWRQADGAHLLETADGPVRAHRVIVATNGYTAEDLHPGLRGRLMPALSNILVTRPLTEAERTAQGWTSTDLTFDTRKLLHYLRLLPDGRFLFGGRGGTDASPAGMARMRTYMERTFRAMFPAWRDVAFTHVWNGFVCLAYDLVPHIAALDAPSDGNARVWCGLAYHGNGVAAATWTGRALARLAAGAGRYDDEVPTVMQGAPPRFPLPGLRVAYLKGAYGAFHLKDQWL